MFGIKTHKPAFSEKKRMKKKGRRKQTQHVTRKGCRQTMRKDMARSLLNNTNEKKIRGEGRIGSCRTGKKKKESGVYQKEQAFP